MLLYRICRARHPPLDGMGAFHVGGRWSPPRIRLVYTSSTLSLAMLEVLAHHRRDRAPADYVRVTVELPDATPVTAVPLRSLPRGWQRYPAPTSLQGIGARWAREGRTPLLRVPSALVDPASGEFNYLLNPQHPALARLRPREVVPFSFDVRLARGR